MSIFVMLFYKLFDCIAESPEEFLCFLKILGLYIVHD